MVIAGSEAPVTDLIIFIQMLNAEISSPLFQSKNLYIYSPHNDKICPHGSFNTHGYIDVNQTPEPRWFLCLAPGADA